MTTEAARRQVHRQQPAPAWSDKSLRRTCRSSRASTSTSPSGEVVVLIGASGLGQEHAAADHVRSGARGQRRGRGSTAFPCTTRKRAPEIRGHVGMVFQQFNLFPHLDALGNVTLALLKAQR